jgi:pathogenesis-related protein 1
MAPNHPGNSTTTGSVNVAHRGALMMLAVCAIAVVFDGDGRAGPRTLSADQQAELLVIHNRWRARVGVPPLQWSTELVKAAQAWADVLARRGCRLRMSDRNDLGENLFYASATESGGHKQPQAVTPTEVVDMWAAESAHYSLSRDRCDRGKSCGHYTQIVWRSTREMGCAMAFCKDRGQVWVCDYWPPGNIIGQRPY